MAAPKYGEFYIYDANWCNRIKVTRNKIKNADKKLTKVKLCNYLVKLVRPRGKI